MSQSQKMKSALKKLVIPNLLDRGFVGKYPHYKKIYDDRIELLSFETNKWGNSFTVEVSTVFLPSSKRDSNLSGSEEQHPIDTVTVWDTNYRYRLRGMFGGWFYYTDVYEDCLFPNTYNGVSEAKAKTYVPQWNEKLVQKADADICNKVCDEINKQMEDAYKWWDLFNKNPKKIIIRERFDEKIRQIKRFFR